MRRHSGAREARTSDAQLRIGESRDCNGEIPGLRLTAHPGMTERVGLAWTLQID